MDSLQKKIWKRIFRDYIIWLLFVLAIIILLYIRTESLEASLTVGLAFAIAYFRSVTITYERFKKELMGKESITRKTSGCAKAPH
jgi:hypothetical protein